MEFQYNITMPDTRDMIYISMASGHRCVIVFQNDMNNFDNLLIVAARGIHNP